MLNTNHARDQPRLFSCPSFFKSLKTTTIFELRKENAK